MKEIKSGIYCIENKINNKKYIGQSKNIADRWYKHKSELKHNSHDNDYLQKSWNKYGEENFNFYVLEYCELNQLDEKEQYYIEKYNTIDRDLGYNLRTGGQNGGSVLSKEAREKLSNSIKESYTEELINKRKQDALNQWANPEIREKVSGENNGMYGKHHSEETKEKIRNKIKDITKQPPKRRKILCVELDMIFYGAREAARYLQSKCASNILDVCYGKRKTAGGYHWQFIEE